LKIKGISCCVPARRIANSAYVKKNKVKNGEKLISLTGIKYRYHAENNTCTSDLVEKAINKLIKRINWKKSEIGLFIFVSQTADYLTPCTSAILQEKLKFPKNLLTFDINLGCSGYSHGIGICHALMSALNIKKCILAVGDISSKVINTKDYSNNILFGDAGSATALELCKDKIDHEFKFMSDGSGYSDIIIPAHSLCGRNKITIKSLTEIKDNKTKVNLHLNGANIYSFAISNVPDFVIKTLNKKAIKYCFFHQANKMIQDQLALAINKKLNKKVIFPNSIKYYGNTSSASIPVTICHNFYNKKISGLSLLCGFGVGLSMSSIIVDLSRTKILKIIKY
jgi:3-oxoacyl-[acyl-carrier-protein] synthase-3